MISNPKLVIKSLTSLPEISIPVISNSSTEIVFATSCDTCLEICPYNATALKRMPLSGSNPYQFDLLELADLTEQRFKARFGKLNWSIDFNTFKRNVLIALKNETN